MNNALQPTRSDDEALEAWVIWCRRRFPRDDPATVERHVREHWKRTGCAIMMPDLHRLLHPQSQAPPKRRSTAPFKRRVA